MKRARRSLVTYSVLGALILALAGYLILRDRDRMRYTLPRLPSVAQADVERLSVQRKDGGFAATRAGDEWRLEPRGYRADPDRMRAAVDGAVDLNLTELVSVTGDYRRYGLDQGAALIVSLEGRGTVLRRFEVGERARTYSHTYVRLEGDDRVFQAAGDLRAVFDLDAEGVRDKLVLSFDAAKASRLRIERGAAVLELSARTVEAGKREWQASDGKPRKPEPVEDALRSLSRLACQRFAEEPDPGAGPWMTVLVTVENVEHRLTVFPKKESTYPARSSQSEYLFHLSAWQVENIEKALAAGPQT